MLPVGDVVHQREAGDPGVVQLEQRDVARIRAPPVGAPVATQQFLETFREYPPSQKPDSWNMEKRMEGLMKDL